VVNGRDAGSRPDELAAAMAEVQLLATNLMVASASLSCLRQLLERGQLLEKRSGSAGRLGCAT
jgi:hypothetical protein